METKFNFNSQVCTSRSQSERLLALGLKKETADMHWYKPAQFEHDYWFEGIGQEWSENDIPAWSLGRLIEMMKKKNVRISFYKTQIKVWGSIGRDIFEKAFYDKDNEWDNLCDCIEWLIKEGYFNKEYLEDDHSRNG